MSENLDLVRSIYADWERGDFSRADWAHPEFEYVVVGGPEPVSGIGLAGMAEAMRGVLSVWDDHRIEAVECRQLDNERVLVFTRASGRGKASGLDLAQMRAEWIDVLRIRGGKVTRLVTYADRDRALADLGLEAQAVSEESTTPDLEEAVRHAFEALNRRDIDAALSLWAPDVVWELPPLGLGVLEGPLIGHEAIRKFSEDLTASFQEFDFEYENFHDLGSGVTFGVVVQRARPHGSDGFLESRVGVVAIWRDARIARATSYQDVDQARAAAERLAEERG